MTSKNKEIAKIVADWWADKLNGRAMQNNGTDGMMSLLMSMSAMQNAPSNDKIEKFRALLAEEVEKKLDQGQEVRLDVDYSPSGLLAEVVRASGIYGGTGSALPCKTMMMATGDYVKLWYGYRSNGVLLYGHVVGEEEFVPLDRETWLLRTPVKGVKNLDEEYEKYVREVADMKAKYIHAKAFGYEHNVLVNIASRLEEGIIGDKSEFAGKIYSQIAEYAINDTEYDYTGAGGRARTLAISKMAKAYEDGSLGVKKDKKKAEEYAKILAEREKNTKLVEEKERAAEMKMNGVDDEYMR